MPHPSAIANALTDRRLVLETVGLPSTMVTAPAVRRQLEELEAIRLPAHRRAMTLHAIDDRETELAGATRDRRLDDELLNGLHLVLELLP